VLAKSDRDSLADLLEQAGITANRGKRSGVINMTVTPKELKDHRRSFRQQLEMAHNQYR
jgi:hypothetical protein